MLKRERLTSIHTRFYFLGLGLRDPSVIRSSDPHPERTAQQQIHSYINTRGSSRRLGRPRNGHRHPESDSVCDGAGTTVYESRRDPTGAGHTHVQQYTLDSM